MTKMFEKLKSYNKEHDIINFLYENKLLISFSFVLIMGMILGTMCVRNISVDTVKNLNFLFVNDFQQRISQPYFMAFIASLSSLTIFIISIIFLTLSSCGIFLVPAVLFFRGFGIGISAGYLYLIHGLKGVAFHILILLPGIFISSIGLILICIESVKFSYEYLKKLFPKSNSESLWLKLKVYFRKITYLMILLVLSSFVDMIFMMLFSRFFMF